MLRPTFFDEAGRPIYQGGLEGVRRIDASEGDLVFLKKSWSLICEHVEATPDQPFFLFYSMQAVCLPSAPAKEFKGKTNAGAHGDFIHQMDWVVGELTKMLEE